MMKKRKIAFSFGTMVLLLQLAFSIEASNGDYGTISKMHFMSNGAVIFYHDGARTGNFPTGCTNQNTRWVIDSSTTGGKSQLSGLLSAYSLKKKVKVVGSGICDPIWSDTEGVSWFLVQD